MRVKTLDLKDKALDWAVASYVDKHVTVGDIVWGNYNPSTNWSQGGLIMAREKISLGNQEASNVDPNSAWYATNGKGREGSFGFGGKDEPLVAVMRCFVMSKMGDSVDVPDELLNA